MNVRMLTCLSSLALLAACAAPSPGSPGKTAGAPSARVAAAAAEAGDLQLAESMCAEAAKAAPTDASAQVRYADALLRRNKISQARNVLVSHLNTVLTPEALRGPLGAIYVLQGKAEPAITEFNAAIATDPANMRWIVNKAIALDLLGRHTDAQTLYRRALAAEPDDAIILTDLALSLALAGHPGEAASVAAPLAERTDLPRRIALTYDVVRAANGSDISAEREEIEPGDYNRALQLAKAIGGSGVSSSNRTTEHPR